jgi:alpha-L-fucosidase
VSEADFLRRVADLGGRGPFRPEWDSLTAYQAPEWYRDAKFGVFVHWGLYSVPAFANEWYSRNMYRQGSPEFAHHVATYGKQDAFGYKDFIPMFRAERFDADEWLGLFKEAGARYIVPVAEHHDGFAMYDSSLTRWNAAAMGPRRDVIGELSAAAERAGLAFGLSSHRAEHWWFMDGGRAFPSDVGDPAYADFYGPATPCSPEMGGEAWENRDWSPRPDAAYLENWLARCAELVERYSPKLFYFDWWIEQLAFEPYLREFAAYFYNRAAELSPGAGAVINYKLGAFVPGSAVFDVERGKLPGIQGRPWQTDTSISYKSWCHVEGDDFRSAAGIVHDLVDIVSKNGCLLLNVGPRADGTIPEEAAKRLREVGAWLAVNGEAVYGTRPWEVYGEGETPVPKLFDEKAQAPYCCEDIRFTRKGDALYAIALGWPAEEWLVKTLGPSGPLGGVAVRSVSLLGSPELLAWRMSPEGLRVRAPGARPCDYAYVLRIELK